VCALLTGGTVACWGNNSAGQLGNGSLTNSPAPVAVTGLTGATAISAGDGFACAVLTGGTVQCWGATLGSTTNSPTPVAVAGLTGATAISSGFDFACALLAGGTVACWGNNSAGQLGDGAMANSLAPVMVTGLSGATAVSVGGLPSAGFACAVLAHGTVECWGFDDDGELGNGSTAFSSPPVAVTGLTGATAVSVSSGTASVEAFACAVLTGGTVECWGENTFGELGNGTTTKSSVPVVVSGLQGATAVSAGVDIACAVVTGGAVQCWGSGALGNGTTTGSSTPVAVTGLTGATAITAGGAGGGGSFECAALAGGTAECWGVDFDGELGNSSVPGRESLTPVVVLTK
jgi:alpha-tubulin suppressor-like RCC1 family protein